MRSWRRWAPAAWARFTADRDGSNPVQLTVSPRFAGSPAWSPHGGFIAYDAQELDGSWAIHPIESSGGAPRPLLHKSGNDRVPSFSRDGRYVYFCSNRNGTDQVYRAPVTGGDPVQVTENGGFLSSESLDGRLLYYTRDGRSSSPLFARSLDGGPERPVLDAVLRRSFVVTNRGIYHFARSRAMVKTLSWCLIQRLGSPRSSTLSGARNSSWAWGFPCLRTRKRPCIPQQRGPKRT